MVNKYKIKCLEKIILYWDVFFTILDQKQLRIWHKMKMKLEDLKYGN